MHTCDCQTALPAGVLRYLRGYKPRLRKYVAAFFAERLAGESHPTIHQVQECISAAYEAFLHELSEDVPMPDEESVFRAMADYREGRWRPIEEIINEIPG